MSLPKIARNEGFVLYAMPDDLYWKSGTHIGPLYDNHNTRWDWGFLSIAVQQEKKIVTILPATEDRVRAILTIHGLQDLLNT